jgi:hypothetical protein
MSRPRQFSLKQLFLAFTLCAVTVGGVAAFWRWSHQLVLKVERDHWRQVYLEGGIVPPQAWESLFTAKERKVLEDERASAQKR